jgi:quercetin 2,3-dioxygenase
LRGPVTPRPRCLLLDVRLAPGSTLELPVPAEHAAFAYVYAGVGSVCGTDTSPGQALVLAPDGGAAVATAAPVAAADGAGGGYDGLRLLLCAGLPLGEPVAWSGPFVMNTKAEIAQAYSDYAAGQMHAAGSDVWRQEVEEAE